MLTALLEARKNRRRLREAKEFLREIERSLKRAGNALSEPVKKQLSQAEQALRIAIEAENTGDMERSARMLDELSTKHLAPYKKSSVREYGESFGFAILAALFLRAFVFEAFVIPSGSMIPTLEINDKIFVNKYIYGLRVPWTYIKFFEWNAPKRGEVIVFIFPQDDSKDYIKRVVGVPGDVVQMKGGQLYVNDVVVQRRAIAGPCQFWDKRGDDSWESKKCEAYQEALDDHDHTIILASESKQLDFGPVKVEPERVFVMGDNRDNSSDSRFWGQVPYKNIKGRAMFIWSAWGREGFNARRLFQWIR